MKSLRETDLYYFIMNCNLYIDDLKNMNCVIYLGVHVWVILKQTYLKKHNYH